MSMHFSGFSETPPALVIRRLVIWFFLFMVFHGAVLYQLYLGELEERRLLRERIIISETIVLKLDPIKTIDLQGLNQTALVMNSKLGMVNNTISKTKISLSPVVPGKHKIVGLNMP